MQDLFSPSKWTHIAYKKLTVSFLVVYNRELSPLVAYFTNQPGTHQTYLDHLFTAVSMVCVTGLTVSSSGHLYRLRPNSRHYPYEFGA